MTTQPFASYCIGWGNFIPLVAGVLAVFETDKKEMCVVKGNIGAIHPFSPATICVGKWKAELPRYPWFRGTEFLLTNDNIHVPAIDDVETDKEWHTAGVLPSCTVIAYL